MKKGTLLIIFILSNLFCWSQKSKEVTSPQVTKASERVKESTKRDLLASTSIGNNIHFRSVGPTVMSGRVTDIEVDPNDATHFYVAYASGGLWETKNNGTSFSPIFDYEKVMTIGDIAVDWKNNIIWVGTGENNSSRSSYSGVGIFKSTDNGKSWEHLGLEESQHISRIVLHPTDPNTIWVGVIGHLFSFNKERGLYKTTDGGKSWKQTLFINDKTGIIDVVIDPNNPYNLYASAWQRERVAWNFVESGSGSGIYKSTDGGEKWELITDGKNGFPTGEGVGRIGLGISPANSNVIYAFLDNQGRRPNEDKSEIKSTSISKDELRKMSKDEFLKLPKEKVISYLKENDFPKKYSYDVVVKMIKKDKIKPIALVEYLEDANSLLFDTPVIGAELYRSDDNGKTWKKTHEGYMDDIVYSYGYYFGNMRVDPYNVDKVYLVAFVVLKSEDGGRTFESINGDNQHVDHHALWVNDKRAGHLINGNDGGINISYDNGATWTKCNSPAVGQFYTVNVDYEDNYNVYGGLQDNGVWWGPSSYSYSNEWHQTGQYPYKMLMGGDGMQVMIDPRDNATVYTGYQFGHYFRINKHTGETNYITPKHELGERPYRWNWQSPIWMSEHNSDVIYFGANKLFRSFNQGKDFKSISDDLTNGGKQGDVSYGTLTTIHESPMKFGLVYTGSDDGLVYVTKDGGSNWTNITKGLPTGYWIRKVQASAFAEGRVYVCLNGHTFDDMSSLLFVSEDYGKTWVKIGTDLPMECVNVVKENPFNENLLFVGTDHGIYFSLNKGKSFMQLDNQLPHVAIHDMVFQKNAHDLVIGTHGRSIYIANIVELENMNDSIMNTEIYTYSIENKNYSKHWGTKFNHWEKPNEPHHSIAFYSKNSSDIHLKILAFDGTELYAENIKAEKGINFFDYKLEMSENNINAYKQSLANLKDSEKPDEPIKAKNGKYYLLPGMYTIQFKSGNVSSEQKFEITKR